MANPTQNKPSVANTRADISTYPALVWAVLLNEAAGAPMEYVSLEQTFQNISNTYPFGNQIQPSPGRKYAGLCPLATAEYPSILTNVSFGSVVNDTALSWLANSKGLIFSNRGNPGGNTDTFPFTFAIVFQHNFYRPCLQSDSSGSYVVPLCAATSNNAGVGIALQVTQWNEVNLCTTINQNIQATLGTDPKYNFLPGHWYAVAVTFSTTTTRVVNIYDFTTQTQVTQASYTDTSVANMNSGTNLSICGTQAGMQSGPIQIYACMGLNESWDSTVNATRFTSFIADPSFMCRRAAYSSSSGTLTPPNVEIGRCTTSSVEMTCGRPQGGTSPYTGQWQYATDDANGIQSGTWHNLGAPFTMLPVNTYTDTGVTQGVVRFYRIQATDAASSVVYSAAMPAMPINGTVKAVLAGTSMYAVNIGGSTNNTTGGVAVGFQGYFYGRGFDVGCVNRAVGGGVCLPPASAANAGISCRTNYAPGMFSINILNGNTTAGTITVTDWNSNTATITISTDTAATIRGYFESWSWVGTGNVYVSFSAGTDPTNTGKFTGSAGSNTLAVYFLPTCNNYPTVWGSKTLNVTYSGFSSTLAHAAAYSLYARVAEVALGEGATVVVELGTNDNPSPYPGQYTTAIQTICTDLLAAGVPKILLVPENLGSSNKTGTTDSRLKDCSTFADIIASMDNGNTIRALPKRSFYHFGGRLHGDLEDFLHSYDNVSVSAWQRFILGQMLGYETHRLLYPGNYGLAPLTLGG